MKLKLTYFLVIFSFHSLISQDIGVNAAYTYSFNQFKDLYPQDWRVANLDSKLKQNIFPNTSLRFFVKLHNKMQVYFGADLSKYEFKHAVYYVSNYSHWNYSRRSILSEVHTPLMLKYEVVKFKEQYPLYIFAGGFARFPVWSKGNILYGNANYDSIPSENYNIDVRIKERKYRYINFVLGAHQVIPFNEYFYGFIDLQAKYMPGNIYVYGSPATITQPMSISNKLSFHLSLGIGIQKPKKENDQTSDPARLND